MLIQVPFIMEATLQIYRFRFILLTTLQLHLNGRVSYGKTQKYQSYGDKKNERRQSNIHPNIQAIRGIINHAFPYFTRTGTIPSYAK